MAVKRTLRLCVLLAFLGWPLSSLALDVTRADAQYADDKFRLDLTVIVNAPLAQVETVLRDYARYPSLDERIVKQTYLAPSDSSGVRYQRARAQVFCRQSTPSKSMNVWRPSRTCLNQRHARARHIGVTRKVTNGLVRNAWPKLWCRHIRRR